MISQCLYPVSYTHLDVYKRQVALIALILVVILALNYLKLLLEAAERYLVLGILVFTAPLAFARGAARGTNIIFKSWCRMFGGQLLLLIMNAWCLKLFVNMVGEFLANPRSEEHTSELQSQR